jgi:eukaryotic-like serine/threonine-protein kinase
MTILAAADLVGSRYIIEKYIGAGSMQEVYRARDKALNRTIAIKTPLNDSAKKRFQRSASVSAQVTHPSVAKTLDYLTDSGRQFLVEELIVGRDLKNELATRYVTLDPHLAAHVFHNVARGLMAVHKVGVAHRDLKPSNIVVSRDPNISIVKITDFGIAKMTEVELSEGLKDDESMSGSATVLGALPYMAPEVILDYSSVGIEADIWSAGALLYELLTGSRPFGEGLQAAPKIVNGPNPSLPPRFASNTQFSQLCGELWKIIQGCLNRDRAARLTATQLVEMCDQLCYSASPRAFGTVSNFGVFGKHWGFIGAESDGEVSFFHGRSVWGATSAGARVSFARFEGDPRSRAFPVVEIRAEDS